MAAEIECDEESQLVSDGTDETKNCGYEHGHLGTLVDTKNKSLLTGTSNCKKWKTKRNSNFDK